MGYFTLLMYKTVIDRGYKSCLLFASYCKSASPINDFFFGKDPHKLRKENSLKKYFITKKI